jgi:branched-chain amino acid aminotransferase
MAQRDAANAGASQALFVYDKEQYITEAGTMNIFLLWKNKMGEIELVTPSLEDGTILAGITRQSVIDLAREWGECKVTERMLPLQEVLDAFNRQDVYEIFGTGTAAVIQPIACISYGGIDYSVPKNAFSENAFQVRMTNTLTAIQYGEIDHPWSRVVA